MSNIIEVHDISGELLRKYFGSDAYTLELLQDNDIIDLYIDAEKQSAEYRFNNERNDGIYQIDDYEGVIEFLRENLPSTLSILATHVVVGYRNFQMGITGSVYTSGQVSETDLDTSGNNSNNRILFKGTEDECYSWLEQNA